jgi:hypothetical protein
MKIRLGSKSGQPVPSLEQSLQEMHAALAQQQQVWADQLAHDPGAFAQLEPQIHRAFQKLADSCAASLLAHAAVQGTCAAAAQKK